MPPRDADSLSFVHLIRPATRHQRFAGAPKGCLTRRCCALAAMSLAVIGVMLIGSADVAAQFDIPQTNLAPIGGSFGNRSLPSGFGQQVAPGYANPGYAGPSSSAPGFSGAASTPRLRFGAGSSGSLFDPYATGAGTAAFPQGNVYPVGPPVPVGAPTTSGPFGGGLFQGGSPSATLGGTFGTTQQAPPIFGGGGYGSGGPSLFGGSAAPPAGGLGGSLGGSIYPPTAFPSGGPSTLFPGGILGGGGIFGRTGGGGLSAFRFLQGPRLRHTFINAGNGKHDLEINDTDVSVAFAVPSFLYSNRPLFIAPSFSLHLWDGPRGTTGSDLPANAYSAFLDFGWQTDPNQMMGLELGARVGAFTDFDTFNKDSIRVLGKVLGSFRVTPYTTAKAGVYYLDRNKVKVLPAGGLLYQPNPYTRFDIFFPQPKIARYWRTVGTRDVWWYATGDYGGGSWSIERDDGSEDSIDINDIRVMLGFEWGLTNLIRVGRRSGFFEVGYVFDREVEYRRNPDDDFNSDDGVLFRAGIGY